VDGTTSLVQVGVPAGLLLAYGTWELTKLVIGPGFYTWGWRLAFALPFLFLVLVGRWLWGPLRRMSGQDHQAREKGNHHARKKAVSDLVRSAASQLKVFRTHPKALAAAFCARLGVDVAFYVFAFYQISYVATHTDLKRDDGLYAVMIGSFAPLIMIPLAGALSDCLGRWGRHKVYFVGAFLTMIWAPIFLWLLDSGSRTHLFLAVGVGLALHAVMYGPQAAFIAEMFSAEVRYIGASFGYHLPGIFGGALASLFLADKLMSWHGSSAVSVYMIAMLGVTMIGVVKGRPSDDIGDSRSTLVPRR
jgi:Na+/melibiose symporter-like transporter